MSSSMLEMLSVVVLREKREDLLMLPLVLLVSNGQLRKWDRIRPAAHTATTELRMTIPFLLFMVI